MTNTVISSYLGAGLLAARPVAPTVDTGAAAFYYGTDTTTLYVYAGGSWSTVTRPATAPTIVQSGVNAGAAIQGVTLGAAPTNGNLLVAIIAGGVPSAGSGWSIDARGDNGGSTESRVFYKIAGSGESATQNPASATGNYGIVIFELSANASPAGPFYASNTGISTLNATPYGFKTAGLIIGGAFSDSSTNLPSSITGATLIAGTAASGTRSAQAFSNTAPGQSFTGDTVTVNWGSSANYRIAVFFVG